MPEQSTLLPSRAPGEAVLASLAVHKLLTRAQLMALTELAEPELSSALQALQDRCLVRALAAHQPEGTAAALHAHALTARGARAAGAHLGQAVRAPHARKSQFLLDHELALSDIAVVLTLLGRRELITLVRFETRRTHLADAAWVREKGVLVRIPLVPDALVVLRHAGKEAALLVEVDRGTVSRRRMSAKYRGYIAWWRSGGAARRFGLKGVRVLTVAHTEKRMHELRALAMRAARGEAPGLCCFGTQAAWQVGAPETLLHAPFLRAGLEDAAPLFP